MSIETLEQQNRNLIVEKLKQLKNQILVKGRGKRTKEIKEKEENKGKKDENEPTTIPTTREYKIYKLGLGSIVSIKGDIQKATVKIRQNPKLSENLSLQDIGFETIIPSILKESMMDNNAISRTGAVGYFQLKPDAVNDVIKEHQLQNLNLDYKNAVDNIILGSLYRKRSLNILKQSLTNNISDPDLEKLMIISYNIGPTRTKELFKESQATNYKEFEKFLAEKLGVTKDPTKKRDTTYGIDYMDTLTDLNTDNLKTWEDKKIAEGLRYVAIIEGISSYIKSNEIMEIVGKVTISKNNTLFFAIKDLRDKGVFKQNANVNEICKIVLESNGYGEKQTPEGTELLIIKDALTDYLP